ncbi:MAG TPA: AI-2E family transporter [Chryseolinea sp.]|nr:AI-2E family transporter [Chryseolinea sp.]
MDGTQPNQPFYLRFSLSLLSLGLLAAGVVLGKNVVVPLLFAVLLSTLLLPITNFLVGKGLPKVLSIALPVLMTLLIMAGVLYFLSSQVMNFIDDAPALKERVSEVSLSFQKWVKDNTNITVTKQNEYIKDTVEDMKEKGPSLVGKTFGSLTGIVTYVILLPIYTFLMLYYRKTIKHFLIGVFKNGSAEGVQDILSESSSIAQKYVTGLLIETTIVFALNTTGFLILGIKYAIFLALLAALLNLIPYVGMLVANIFCMLVTLLSSDDASNVLWVGVVLAAVQFIDNNFTMPWIVGNKVKINALVTIVGVLVGGLLCGIPGMFLAIPGLAVLKVIFDKVPQLHPWGILLGDEMPGESTSGKSDTDNEGKQKGPFFKPRKKVKTVHI